MRAKTASATATGSAVASTSSAAASAGRGRERKHRGAAGRGDTWRVGCIRITDCTGAHQPRVISGRSGQGGQQPPGGSVDEMQVLHHEEPWLGPGRGEQLHDHVAAALGEELCVELVHRPRRRDPGADRLGHEGEPVEKVRSDLIDPGP